MSKQAIHRRYGLVPLLLGAGLALSSCSGGGASAGGVAGGGKPEGMFFMTRYYVGTHSLEKSAYYFAPDGQVYQNPTGLAAANLSALPPGQRGTYAVDGKKLTIKLADGNGSSSDVEGDNPGGFNYETGIFTGVKPFAKPTDLLGAFEGGNSVSFGGGSTSASNALTFKHDGTFTQEGAVSSSVSSDQSTAHVGNSDAGAGHYQLAGWTLTLTDAQGQKAQGVAFPIETDEKTGQVVRFYYQNIAYKRLGAE
ncbi:MAG: hypothetical protein ACRYFX_22920 [Janthinobacterium lividum]